MKNDGTDASIEIQTASTRSAGRKKSQYISKDSKCKNVRKAEADGYLRGGDG